MPELLQDDIRTYGPAHIRFSSVSLGCWPLAGVTTLDVNRADSIATVAAACDAGIVHFDTAYVYGEQGESETCLAQVLPQRRDQVTIATKGGVHFEAGKMVQDASPATLKAECETSLQRLEVDSVELHYLHSPDPEVPLEDSIGALAELQAEGKTRSIGVSNCTLKQIREAHAVSPLTAVQLPFNMLQQDIQQETVPWCQEHGVAVMVYWPLMKGLLAGKLPRDGQLAEGDSRRGYPMYQGEEWEANQHFVDQITTIAESLGKSVAQLVINWTLQQPGITSALCGAKRAWQIEETAGAMGWRLAAEDLAKIETAIAGRGHAAAKRTFK